MQSEIFPHKPQYWELASYTDNQYYYDEAIIAYWYSSEEYEDWVAETGFGTWWESLGPETEECGWFKEIFFPAIDRFETVFSSSAAEEGAAHMKEGMSGAIKEHVYWGSMRDRLPASQTDSMTGDAWKPPSTTDEKRLETKGQRIKVPSRRNLAVIRSGQDWSSTLPAERHLYLQSMHPILLQGMDFLRDHGSTVGCICNRFMSVTSCKPPGRSVDKTFGLGYFDDLGSLERWSRSHKTHLDIFGGFLRYAKELRNEVSLKLFHEVLVLGSEQQEFEYVNCHGGTGMLPTLR